MIFEAPYIKIENCKEQATQTECMVCEHPYILSQDRTKCKLGTHSSDEHCEIYSNYECKGCREGFYFDQNNYIRGFGKGDNWLGDSFNKSLYLIENTRETLPLETCLKIVDINCKQFQGYNKCLICNTGYFLNQDYFCELIPEPKIKNCIKYDENLNCVLCD